MAAGRIARACVWSALVVALVGLVLYDSEHGGPITQAILTILFCLVPVGVLVLAIRSRLFRLVLFGLAVTSLAFGFPPGAVGLLVWATLLRVWWLNVGPFELWTPRLRWRSCAGCRAPSRACERLRPHWLEERDRPAWATRGVMEYRPWER